MQQLRWRQQPWAIVTLFLVLLCRTSAFLLPLSPGRISTSSQTLGGYEDGRAEVVQSPMASVRRASVIVSMGKGRKSEKKRKAAPRQDKQQEPKTSSDSPASATSGSEEGSEGADKEQTFTILGSAPPLEDKAKGFGAKQQPTSKQVDEAYERALSKIKGTASPLGGSLKQPEGGPPQQDGKVPVRNVDIFDFLPESVQSGFETTLIAGLALNLLVVVVLGLGFAIQALPTSNVDLPQGVVDLSNQVRPLVDKYEGLFTPSLGVFFLLSTILGSFKIAQLGKGATEYRERK